MAAKERILVTGGAGFIGSHLVDHLMGQGHEVVVLDNLSTGMAINLADHRGDLNLIDGSINDPGALEKALKGVSRVFHLAAIASVQASIENPLKTHEVIATGTLMLLEKAAKAGVKRVVYAGSSSAYGRTQSEFLRENDPLDPLSPYAAAKLAGEMYCKSFTRTHPLEAVILRFFNVFGPRQRPDSPYSGVIALFAKALVEGRTPTIFGDGLQTRDFVYVTDVVQCLDVASTQGDISGQVFHVGTGHPTNLWQLVEALNQVLGTSIRPEVGPARVGDVRHSCANLEKTRQILGWQPVVTLNEGLNSTLAWMAQA